MTCKDCIHYKVCYSRIRLGMEYDIHDEPDQHIEESCRYFDTGFNVETVVNRLETLRQKHKEFAAQMRWKEYDELRMAGCYKMAIKIVQAYAKTGEQNERPD